MKRTIQILITTLFIILSNVTFAQTEYPTLLKNNDGVFIVFTIGQANHINNTYDLNLYLDSIISQLEDKDDLYLMVIDSSNKVISKFNIILSAQNQKIKNFQEINDNLTIILDGYRKESEIFSNDNAILTKKVSLYKSLLYVSGGINVILLTLILLR